MKLVLCSALLLGLACTGGESPTLSVTTGLEASDGIVGIESARELAVYPYHSGGHVAHLWIGDDVPEDCLVVSATNLCVAKLFVGLDGEVVLDRSFWIGNLEAPLQGWIRRIEVPLDFAALGFPAEAPLGQLVDLQFSLDVNGVQTPTTTAAVTLVQGSLELDAQ